MQLTWHHSKNARFSSDKLSVSVRGIGMRFRLLFLLLLTFPSLSFAELVVEKPQWGFDGTVVRECFNILTVTVRNTGGQAYEGVMKLGTGGLSSRDSADYSQAIFLAPGSSRTVQFYPKIYRAYDDYRITWSGKPGGETPVGQLKLGSPRVVILADMESISARTLRMPAFHEGNFPVTVSATDALFAVVLDHQPRWDPARREAFLDWVKRGGIVHLVKGADGNVPNFQDDLAALNITEDKGAVGAGKVIKHAATIGEVTPELLGRAGYFAPPDPDNRGYDGGARDLFRMMAEISKPDLAWGAIYLLTFAYIALIGPVFYSQRRRDYRWLLGSFVGTVIVFASIFTIVGRRGYGENQIYHSLALARSIDGNRWDVRHWVYPFATSGDEYRFNFAGGTQLYAADGNGDAVRGEVIQGKDGGFVADIPLFSSRSFEHQGVMQGPSLKWQVEEFELDGSKIRKGQIRLADPSQADLRSVIVQLKTGFYEFRPGAAGGWNSVSGQPSDASRVFPQTEIPMHDYDYRGRQAVAKLQQAPSFLAGFITGDSNRSRAPLATPLETGVARIYAFADAPGLFPLTGKDFQPQTNGVLFVQEVALPKR